MHDSHTAKARTAATLGLILAGVAASAARAEVPRVAVDVAPVHGLVAAVLGDLGTPDLILPPGASPHGYALRPSEARALQAADIVVWVGEDLTPWLEDPIETLAPDARHLALMEVPGTRVLDRREMPVFGSTAAADDHGQADAHAHDAHAHDDHGHDDHGHDDHAHDHGLHDAHAWLDPANAALWLDGIAAALGAADPENAEVYAANAAAARAGIDALSAEIAATVGAAGDLDLVVFHDAYQYFEAATGLRAVASIAISEASSPSAARVRAVRDAVRALDRPCIGAEPQFDPGLVAAVAEGTGARTVVMDPLGADIPLGPDHYGATLRALAGSLAACAAKS